MLGPIQWDPSHGSFAFVSPNNGIYDPQVADSSLLYLHSHPPLDDTEFPSWSQSVYTPDLLTSHLNPVSGETDFSQDSGPLAHPPYALHYTSRVISAVGQLQSDRIRLSRSESPEPPLIIDQNPVRYEMSARWRYLTLDILQNSMTQHSVPGSGLHNSSLSSYSGGQVIMVPQRPYAKRVYESLVFKVNGCPGIPARHAIDKIYTGLDGRDDPVFVDKADVMTLRLEVRSIADCEELR